MQIHFERSGGFSGIRMSTTLDSESLSLEEIQDFQELVKSSKFFDLPEKITSPKPGADRFQYKLTVEDEGRRHTVEMSEAAIPETLQPLLQRLNALARSARDS